MFLSPARLVFCASCVLSLVAGSGWWYPDSAASAETLASTHRLRKDPTWHIQTTVQPDAKAGGWFLNLGITGARGKIEVDTPTVLDVTYIFEDTPAFGRLKVGDHIIGANDEPFTTAHKFGYGVEYFGYQGPMMDLGNALEQAQGEPDRNGRLSLTVMRGDEQMNIELPLGTRYGSYSATYPFQCDKTDRVLAEMYTWLAEKQGEDGYWHRGRYHIDCFAALSLLASGDAKYRPHTRRAARAFARDTTDRIEYDGLDCWKYTLYGIYLAEYHLATNEHWVLAELQEINRWLLQAQMTNGGWGHRPANRPGGNGYGAFAAMTAQAKLAWSLMIKCGIEIDQDRYKAAHEFLMRGTNEIGYLWYADEIGHPTHYADMGRTGTSAVAHLVAADTYDGYGQAAARYARCIGEHPVTFPDTHGSPLLGMAFTALGTAADAKSLRQLFDHNRWHFALAQCPDGTFYYQPNRDNNAQDYTAAPRLSATAATALVLSMKHRSLAMTRNAGLE